MREIARELASEGAGRKRQRKDGERIPALVDGHLRIMRIERKRASEGQKERERAGERERGGGGEGER